MPTASLLWLCLLFAADGAFAGWRAVAGRTGRIRTLGLYTRAGALGAAGSGAYALLVLATGAFSLGWPAPPGTGPALRWMVSFYSVFAALLAAGFTLRALPSVDLRTLSSLLVFGPLTLLRPVVILLGLAAAGWLSPALWAPLSAAVVGSLLLPWLYEASFHRLLGVTE